MLVMGLAPILAPMLGGLMVNLYGWQSIFWRFDLFQRLVLAGGISRVAGKHAGRHQPVTRCQGRCAVRRLFNGHGLSRPCLDRRHRHGRDVCLHRRLAFRVHQTLRRAAEHYGWLFGTNAAGFILVAQVNARIAAKLGPAFLLARAVWLYLARR